MPLGSKYAITGDFHIHPYGEFSRTVDHEGLTSRAGWISKTAEWLAGSLRENGSSLVLNGDLTTTPGHLDAPTLSLLARVEKVFGAIPRIYNLGNHDLASRDGVLHNLALHNHIPAVTVVTTVTYFENLDLYVVPYTTTIERQREYLATIPDGSTVCIHYPVVGVKMTPVVSEETGLEPIELLRFQTVWASHYHLPQVYYPGRGTVAAPVGTRIDLSKDRGKIIVTGTPIAHSFGDTSAYGVWFCDGDGATFLANPHSPTYGSYKISSVAELESIPADIDYLKIEFVGHPSLLEEVRSRAKAFNNVKVSAPRQEQSAVRGLSLTGSVDESVKRYLEHRGESSMLRGVLDRIKDVPLPVPDPQCVVSFRKLEVENFLSWGSATLDFSSQLGKISAVVGANEDASAADSNGSGKSSLFEALVWCLYDTTPRGISKNSVVRSGAGQCSVAVEFEVEGKVYTVRRTRKGTSGVNSVTISDGLTDLTRSTTAETDRLIGTVLGVSVELLYLTSFFGQGMESRFSTLSDSERKRLLESVLNLKVYDTLSTHCNRELKQSLASQQRILSCIETSSKDLVELGDKLSHMEVAAAEAESARDLKLSQLSTDLEQATSLLTQFRVEQESLEKKNASLRTEWKSLGEKLSSAKLSLASTTLNKNSAKKELARLVDRSLTLSAKASQLPPPSDTCPTCKSPLLGESLRSAVEAFDEQMRAATAEILSVQSSMLAVEEDVYRLTMMESTELSTVGVLEKEVGEFQYPDLEEEKSLASSVASYTVTIQSIGAVMAGLSAVDHRASLRPIRDLISSKEDSLRQFEQSRSVVDSDVEAWRFCDSTFSMKGIRSYLLDGSIATLNQHISSLCSDIFGTDFSMQVSSVTQRKDGEDANRISIEFASPAGSYTGSSGGERRKADLVLQLALASLCTELGRGTTNLLVADEVLDSLDQTSSRLVVEALVKFSSDYSRASYLISHSPGISAILPDVIRVTKENGVSRIVE